MPRKQVKEIDRLESFYSFFDNNEKVEKDKSDLQLEKWIPIIKIFDEKGIEPEEIMNAFSLIEKITK